MTIRCGVLVALFIVNGCDRTSPRSPVAAEERAIQRAQAYCQDNRSDFGWLRQRVRALERSSFTQQHYILVFATAQGTLFAAGLGPTDQPSGAWLDCQGRAVQLRPAQRQQLVGKVIYAPPIYRR